MRISSSVAGASGAAEGPEVAEGPAAWKARAEVAAGVPVVEEGQGARLQAAEGREPQAVPPVAGDEGGVGDVARAQDRELAHVAVEEGAALALLGSGSAGVPHKEVGDQLGPTVEDVD